MKLVRYGAKGRERPGLTEADGRVRDLSGVVDDIAGDVLLPEGIARIAARAPESLPLFLGQKPPVFLKGGEVMRPGIGRLDGQTQRVMRG